MGTFDGPILTVPCTNATLDRWLNIRGCCEAHARFERELVAAMKVMKYSMQPPIADSIAARDACPDLPSPRCQLTPWM